MYFRRPCSTVIFVKKCKVKMHDKNQVRTRIICHQCISLGSCECYDFGIQHYTQKLVDADRASLFQVDHYSHELYARIFDVQIDDDVTNSKENCLRHKEIR